MPGVLLPVAAARAGSSITPKPTSGHPDTAATFTGGGFAASEAVDIYVDTTDTLLLVSSASGTISGSVTIPLGAQPGPHYITAIGRHSGNAAQAAFTVTTPWNEQGFGAARLGWNPWENTLTPSNVPLLGALWTAKTGAGSSSPAVAAGRLYVGSLTGGAGIEALSTNGGGQIWHAAGTDTFDVAPALANGNVYIGSIQGVMYAASQSTGSLVWANFGFDGFESAPVVNGSVVYAGCDDGKLYAFQAVTSGPTAGGTVLWSYATGLPVTSAPAVWNNTIYFGSYSTNVYALTLSGSLLWSHATGGPVVSSPAVSGGVVYVGSLDSKVYAIKAVNGALVWTATTGAAINSSPAVAYGLVFVGSDDGNLYALNAHTGAVEWSVYLGGAVASASPSVADGVVYAASTEGTLYAIDATGGNILWTHATGSGGFSNPTISDGTVYFSSGDGFTYAFAADAGTSLRRFRRRAPAISSLHPDLTLRISD